MSRSRFQLTDELQAEICDYIRRGATPELAAQAAGIPQRVFEQWMHYSEARRPVPRYRAFGVAVRQAMAIAFLAAQIDVHRGQGAATRDECATVVH